MNTEKQIVITVGRQLGSGGSYIAEEVAKRLGIFYADRSIIRGAAEKLTVQDHTVAEREESIPGFWSSFINTQCVYPELYVPPVVLAPTDFDLYTAESDVITRIAAERSAVILGRLAFHVLRNHPRRVSIYCHASLDYRIARYAQVYNTTEAEAKKQVVKCDKQRKQYCRMFANVDPFDARNYDLAIDTERAGSLDHVVEFILQYLQFR